MRRWKDQDLAVSPVLATIMLVAIAVVLSAVVYAFASGTQGEAPESLALTQGLATSANERSFSVASASQTLRWSDMQPMLAGVPLTYDGALASDNTWCRETPDGVCVATASYDPNTLVQAGQRIRVHHSAFEGQTFQVRDVGANSLLASIPVR